jgi:hypothetical protein
MPLTDTAIRNAKPDEKPYKLTDGKGLYLLVNKVGKYFRFDYRYRGKRKTLAIGVYPDTTLKEARDEHESARKLLRKDIDPGLHKKFPSILKRSRRQIPLSLWRGSGLKNISIPGSGAIQKQSPRGLRRMSFPGLEASLLQKYLPWKYLLFCAALKTAVL